MAGQDLLRTHIVSQAGNFRRQHTSLCFECCFDKAGKQRVAIARCRRELGMELATQEPRVTGNLNYLDQGLIH